MNSTQQINEYSAGIQEQRINKAMRVFCLLFLAAMAIVGGIVHVVTQMVG